MSKTRTFIVRESVDGIAATSVQPSPDALTAAIRKPLEALDAAAEEAAKGRLGAAKLGLLVAANGIIEALKAADAEFARRYATRPQEARSGSLASMRLTDTTSDRHDETIDLLTRSLFRPSL